MEAPGSVIHTDDGTAAAAAAAAAKRMARIEALVEARLSLLQLIRRTHQATAEDPVHWANVVRLTQRQIRGHHASTRCTVRFRQLLALGVSLGTVLPLPSGSLTVHAVFQLVAEYEHFFGLTAASVVHELKSLVSRGSGFPPSVWDEIAKGHAEVPGPPKQRIYKRAYQHLVTPTFNGPLDPIECTFSLCDVLGHLYRKFLDPAGEAQPLHDAIVKIDGVFKSVFFGPMTKDLTDLASQVFKAAVPFGMPVTAAPEDDDE